MAAEAQRMPRVACGLTSMAAAAAGRSPYTSFADSDLIEAWVAVFQAAGGVLMVDCQRRQSVSYPVDFTPISDVIGTTVFTLANRDERLGALKALRAVLDLCGRPTRDEVFAFANVIVGEG